MGLLGSLGQVAYDIIAQDKTGEGSKSSEKNLIAVGAAMTGVGVAAIAMTADVKQSFLTFEESTTAIKALGVLSEEEFNRARQAALDMSKQFPVSATEVTGAMYSMISVGYDFDTMMKVLPEAIQLSVGGNMDLAEAVNTVINVFGAYGEGVYSAADVTNILAKAVGVGKWELGDFTDEIMKNVGAGANLGISFNELAAANVLLQNSFTSSEVAGTSLNTMLTRLVDPTVIQKLEDMGVHVKDNEGNFVGLKSVLDQLEVALQGTGGNVEKMSILQEIFGTYGVKAAMALLDEKDALGELSGEMNDASFKSESFNTVLESTSSQLEIATNKTEAAKIAFGEAMAPAMMITADATGLFADALSSLPDPLQSVAGLAIYAAQGFAVLGPALMGLAALKTLGIGATLTSIASGFSSIGTAALTLALANPILAGFALGILGIAALKQIGFLDWVYEQGQNARKWLDGILDSFNKTADGVEKSTQRIKDASNVNLKDTSKSLEEANSSVKTNTKEINETAEGWSVDFSGIFGGVSDTLRNWGEIDLKEAWMSTAYSTGAGIAWVQNTLFSLPPAAMKMGNDFGSYLLTVPEKARSFASGVVEEITKLPETIPGLIQGAGEALVNLPQTMDTIRSDVENIDLSGAASTVIGGVGGVFSGALSVLGPPASGLTQFLDETLGNLFAGYSDNASVNLLGYFSSISTAFTSLGGKVQEAFSNLFTGISEFIVGLAQGFITMGYNIIMYLVQGMQSAAGAIGDTIGNIFNIIGQFIPHSPAETGPLSQLPNFGAYFVDPLLATVPAVEAASAQMAEAIAMPAAQPASMSGGTNIGSQDNSSTIDIGSINASSDYPIDRIMADIAAMQAQRRTQRGYST